MSPEITKLGLTDKLEKRVTDYRGYLGPTFDFSSTVNLPKEIAEEADRITRNELAYMFERIGRDRFKASPPKIWKALAHTLNELNHPSIFLIPYGSGHLFFWSDHGGDINNNKVAMIKVSSENGATSFHLVSCIEGLHLPDTEFETFEEAWTTGEKIICDGLKESPRIRWI